MTFVTDDQPLHPDYPLPDVDDPVMRPFWEGAREGRLMLQRERATGAVHWPPKPIYSYVVGHEPFLPAFRHLLPLVLVLVEVEEGPRLVGYMVGCPPEEMRFGMKVRVVFKRLTERVTLPVWEPDR